MTQKRLPLTDSKESQRERCRRILAGVPKLTTAAAMTFTAEAAQMTSEEFVDMCCRVAVHARGYQLVDKRPGQILTMGPSQADVSPGHAEEQHN